MSLHQAEVLWKNWCECDEKFVSPPQEYYRSFLYVLMEIGSQNRQMGAFKQSQTILQILQIIWT